MRASQHSWVTVMYFAVLIGLSGGSGPRRSIAMIKSLLVCIALASFMAASPANSQEAPPPSDQAKRIEDLVNRAAALVEQRGQGGVRRVQEA
jgi:hypothetical protein